MKNFVQGIRNVIIKWLSINRYVRSIGSSLVMSFLLVFFFNKALNSIQNYFYYMFGINCLITPIADFVLSRFFISLFLTFIIHILSLYMASEKSRMVNNNQALLEQYYYSYLVGKTLFYKIISFCYIFMICLKIFSVVFLNLNETITLYINFLFILFMIIFLINILRIKNREISVLFDELFGVYPTVKHKSDDYYLFFDYIRLRIKKIKKNIKLKF